MVSTDMSDQDTLRRMKRYSTMGSIHSSDLDFDEVDSNEGASHEGAYEDSGYDSAESSEEERPWWSSEDEDAADLVLSADVVGDLDNGQSSQASHLACTDVRRSPSFRGSNGKVASKAD